MYRDSLGNTYAALPPKKPNPSAKPSKGGNRKHGRSARKGEWIRKVKSREALARNRGLRFTTYPC